jgi:hypothetical protein
MNKFLILFIVLFFFSIQVGKSISIGISPPSIDLGELKRGEIKEFSFDLLTSYTENVLIYVQVEKAPRDIIARYTDILDEISEEDASSWIKIDTNPITLQLVNETLQTRKVVLKITIPQDAEPGYHFLKIIPKPIVTKEVSSQVGGIAVSITSIILKFRVEGNVEQKGKILDTVVTYENGRANFETYFLNQGNVTLEIKAIFMVEGENQSLTVHSPYTLVQPNKVAKLSTSSILKTGIYNLTTSVYWLSGNTSKFQTVEVKETKKEIVFIPKIDYLPLIILIIIIIISYLIGKYV